MDKKKVVYGLSVGIVSIACIGAVCFLRYQDSKPVISYSETADEYREFPVLDESEEIHLDAPVYELDASGNIKDAAVAEMVENSIPKEAVSYITDADGNTICFYPVKMKSGESIVVPVSEDKKVTVNEDSLDVTDESKSIKYLGASAGDISGLENAGYTPFLLGSGLYTKENATVSISGNNEVIQNSPDLYIRWNTGEDGLTLEAYVLAYESNDCLKIEYADTKDLKEYTDTEIFELVSAMF